MFDWLWDMWGGGQKQEEATPAPPAFNSDGTVMEAAAEPDPYAGQMDTRWAQPNAGQEAQQWYGGGDAQAQTPATANWWDVGFNSDGTVTEAAAEPDPYAGQMDTRWAQPNAGQEAQQWYGGGEAPAPEPPAFNSDGTVMEAAAEPDPYGEQLDPRWAQPNAGQAAQQWYGGGEPPAPTPDWAQSGNAWDAPNAGNYGSIWGAAAGPDPNAGQAAQQWYGGGDPPAPTPDWAQSGNAWDDPNAGNYGSDWGAAATLAATIAQPGPVLGAALGQAISPYKFMDTAGAAARDALGINAALQQGGEAITPYLPAPDTLMGEAARTFLNPYSSLDDRGKVLTEVVTEPFQMLARGAERVIGAAARYAGTNADGTPSNIGDYVNVQRTGASVDTQVQGYAQRVQNELGYVSPHIAEAGYWSKPLQNGDDPATWAAYQVQQIAYSGPERMARTAQRILLGEAPEVAMHGAEAPKKGAFEDEKILWQTRVNEHLNAVERAMVLQGRQAGWAEGRVMAEAKAARDEAARQVNATGRINGGADVILEMVGQALIDPMNLPGAELLMSKVTGKLVQGGIGAERAAETATKVFDATMVDELKAARLGLPEWVVRAENGAAALSERNGLLGQIGTAMEKALQKGETFFGFTPDTQAHMMTGQAWKQVGDVLMNAENAGDAAKMLGQLANDPTQLVGVLGNGPVSLAAEMGRPAIQGALGKLTELIPEFTRADGGLDVARYLDAAGQVIESAAKAAIPGAGAEAEGIFKLAAQVKGLMSEFYLKTPSYIVRNFASDTMTATLDGLRMFENMDTVTRELDQLGVTTKRMFEGAKTQAGLAAEMGGKSALANVTILKDTLVPINNKLGDVAQRLEAQRYTRAMWSALTENLATNWKPTVSPEFRALVGDEVANAVEARLRTARSGKEVRLAYTDVLSAQHPAQRFSVASVLDRVDDLPLGMQRQIEAKLGEFGAGKASYVDVMRYVDELREGVERNTNAKMSELGQMITPRATTHQDALLDIEQELTREYNALVAHAVNTGEMSMGEAKALVNSALGEKIAQEREIFKARQILQEAMKSPELSADRLSNGMRYAMNNEAELRGAARLEADTRLAKAYQELKDSVEMQVPVKTIWDNYRADVARIWQGYNKRIYDSYMEVAKDLRNATSTYQYPGVEATFEKLIAQMQKNNDAKDLELFEKNRNMGRLNWEVQRADSWRQAQMAIDKNPDLAQDLLDVMWAAETDVQNAGRQAVGKKEIVRQILNQGDIDITEYGKRVDKIWKEFFDYAEARHGDALRKTLRGVEVTQAKTAEALMELGYGNNIVQKMREEGRVYEWWLANEGYGNDELARLMRGLNDGSTRAEVVDILENRKAYDPEAAARTAEMYRKPWADGALRPPPDADVLMVHGKFESEAAALKYAQGQLEEAASLTANPFDELMETRKQMPSKAEVNRWLMPDGTPRGDWLETGSKDADKIAQEYFEARGKFYGDDQTGGQLQAWYDELKRAQDTDKEIGAYRSGTKAARKAETDAADKAATQWAAVVDELQARVDAASGIDAKLIGLRDDVLAIANEQGIADAAAVVNDMAKGSSEARYLENVLNQYVLDEISAMFDNPNAQVHEQLPQVIATLLERKSGMSFSPSEPAWYKTAELWAADKGLVQVGGAQREWLTSVARGLADEAGIDISQFIAGERGITEMIKDARAVNEGLVNRLLAVPTTKDGTVTAKAWQGLIDEGVVTGERRTVAAMLREIAPNELRTANYELRMGAEARGLGLRDVPSTPVLEMSTEDLLKASGQSTIKARAEPPTVIDLATAAERKTLEGLQRVQAALTPERLQAAIQPLPKGAMSAAEAEIRRMIPALNEVRTRAIAHSEARANFALLDYGKRRGFDAYAGLVAPYYYWASRQARNFAIRMADKPQLMANWVRYRDAMEDYNKERGTRKRFQGGYELPFEIGGNKLYWDPTGFLFPFADLANTDFDNPAAQKTWAQSVYDRMGMIGFRPGPMIDLPMRYMNLLVSGAEGSQEREQTQARYGAGSIGNVIPQTGLIRGASALLGLGGTGGIDIEGYGRRALGLSVAPTEAYDLGRAIRDLAGERQGQKGFDSQPYLLAQALLQNRDAQYWQRLMSEDIGTLVAGLAKDKNLPTSQLPQAIEIIRAAQQKATQQRGAQTLFSFMGGQRVQVEAQGERVYNAAAAAERGAGYNAVTNIGSRAERQAVTKANPVLAVGQAQYATNPGVERDPLSNWKWNEKEKITAQFDAQRDAAIIKAPWDRKAPAEIEKQKWAAMGVIDGAGKPVMQASALDKAMVGGVAGGAGQVASGAIGGGGGYVPKSIYGASPQEAVEVRRGEVLKAVAASAPKAEAFMSAEGKVDFDAYKKAVEGWRKELPILAANIGTDILAQAQRDGHWNGEQLKAWLGTVDAGMIDEYRRRNDSAAEAAQRAWFELVYTRQFDALGKAKGEKDAYAKTVGSVGAMDAGALAGLVQQMYGGRWTDAQLGTLLKGMTMPAMGDVIRNNMTPDKRALDDARTQFYKLRDEYLPPGRLGLEASKAVPLLAALMDGKLNDMATAEHYRLGALMLGGWAKANKVESNPVEWAAAREMKARMDADMQGRFGAAGLALLNQYYAAAAGAERAALLGRYPEIKVMLDAQSKWRAEPLYQKYYASEGSSQKSVVSSQKSVASSQTGGGKAVYAPAAGAASSAKAVSAEFWQAYNAIDTKSRGALVRGNADLMRVVDSATRGTATTADWQRALKALGGSGQKPVASSQTGGGKAATSYTPKPAAGYAPKPATSYTPKPATSYTPKPATGYAPKPAAGYAPKPATSYTPKPATSYAPKAAAGYAPKPAAGYAPKPAAGYAPKGGGGFVGKGGGGGGGGGKSKAFMKKVNFRKLKRKAKFNDSNVVYSGK